MALHIDDVKRNKSIGLSKCTEQLGFNYPGPVKVDRERASLADIYTSKRF